MTTPHEKPAASSPVESGKTTISPQKAQQRKTILAAVVMLIPFSVFMYMIFKEKAEPQTEQVDGINLTMPDGKSKPIEGSKQKAVERAQAENKQDERTQAVAQNPFSLLESNTKRENSKPTDTRSNHQQSQQAYREATRQMNDFYTPSKRNDEIEELKKQVAELTDKLEQQQVPKVDPMAVVERSYALASKYLGGTSEQPAPTTTLTQARSPAVTAVRRLSDHTVSALRQRIPDTTLIELLQQPRNFGFNTPVGNSSETAHNGIRACVAADQIITNGSRVKLRLLEAMQAGTVILPLHAELFGTATIDGQRMNIVVSSIELGGSIVSVKLTAHDLDGQPGLFVPNTAERTAIKDAAASIGGGFATSVSFARSAGQQVAMDVVRGAMTGGTQYLAGKLREVKVSVKANYQLLLISKE